ncbi:hypothetical protein ABZX65_09970 [Streptomyces sp. NPDC003300]|uniref:hypothetical protein n=1 Tax=unclassified Streptomyces TaxID=2593676 RepID=UPI0033AF579C
MEPKSQPQPQPHSQAVQQVAQDHVSGLRMVALASVAALAVVLPLAAATDGPSEHPGHGGHSGHAGLGAPHARTTSVDGYGMLPPTAEGT